jgi:hypothetical protein
VALVNHEDRVWSKSKKYAPVLSPDSMRLMVSMAVQKHCTMCQGDCKNAFCQGILSEDKITIVKPPIGNPDATKNKYWFLKRTLHGLRRSPHHWYTKINSVLNQLGLKSNSLDLCLFMGHIVDSSHPEFPPSTSPITLGLYVDNFRYFSKDPAIEQLFDRLLSQLVTVDFLGTVEWFLCTHFQWLVSHEKVSVHLSQIGFGTHLVKENNVHKRNITPDATPYRSSLPIDAIPESDKDNKDPALIECK